MTTAASGCITKAEERIRNMFANCTAFQTWVGAADATAAQRSIYYDAVPRDNYNEDSDPLSWHISLRPLLCIYTTEFYVVSRHGPGGTVMATFIQNTPDASVNDWEEADRTFKNTLGSILLSGDGANPGLYEWNERQVYAPLLRIEWEELYRTNEEEYDTFGDAQSATFRINWGASR